MKPHWIIQTNVFKEDYDKAFKGLDELGHTYTQVDNVLQEVDVNNSGPVIVRGSIPYVMSLKNKPWIPGREFGDSINFDNYRCSKWMSEWREINWMFLNRNAKFIPLNLIVSQNSLPFPRFVRPDSGLKGMTGYVYKNVYEFVTEVNYLINQRSFAKDLMCVVAPAVKKDLTEVRIVIAGDQPISGSIYRLKGQIVDNPVEFHFTAEHIRMISKVTAMEWKPAPIYILDMTLDSRDNVDKIVEINAFNTSSLYGCDLKKVFDVAGSLALDEFNNVN